MKALLALAIVLLAGCATAQFPPPYVHNYWTTQAQAQVNSPIMNAAKQMTNNVKADTGLFRSLASFDNFTCYGTNVPAFTVDELTGTNRLALFLNTVNNRSVTISSNADISIGAGIYSGDGSGLTNLPVSGAAGIATLNGSGTNTTMRGLTNIGVFTLRDNPVGNNDIFLTNSSAALWVGAIGSQGSINAANFTANGGGGLFTGVGSGLSALNASQLTGGTVPDARLSANVALVTNVPKVLFSQYNFSNNIGTGETTTFTNTLPASMLGQAGQCIDIFISTINNAGAGVTRTIKVYLGTTVIYNGGGNNQAGSVTTEARIRVMRGGSATTGIVSGYQVDSGNNVKGTPTQSSENLGTALGLGVTLTGNTGTGDITNRITTVTWYPAGQ